MRKLDKNMKSIKEKKIRKLAKVGSGTSYAITLPMEAVKAFGWRERQKLEIEIDYKTQTLIIKDWKK